MKCAHIPCMPAALHTCLLRQTQSNTQLMYAPAAYLAPPGSRCAAFFEARPCRHSGGC